MKDEWTFDIVRFLGTEGMANQQAGRKPGRGSKRLSQVEAETGLMYRSDTKPRVIAGSTVFTIEKVKNWSKGMLQIVLCRVHESPGSRVHSRSSSYSTLEVNFRCQDIYHQVSHTNQIWRWIVIDMLVIMIVYPFNPNSGGWGQVMPLIVAGCVLTLLEDDQGS